MKVVKTECPSLREEDIDAIDLKGKPLIIGGETRLNDDEYQLFEERKAAIEEQYGASFEVSDEPDEKPRREASVEGASGPAAGAPQPSPEGTTSSRSR